MRHRTEREKRLLGFRPVVGIVHQTLEAFHEWNVELALAEFKAKRTNNEPVTFFNFQRGDGIIVMESKYENGREKMAVQETVRGACKHDPGVRFVCSIAEVWIHIEMTTPERTAGASIDALLERYGSVEKMPGREDGLMVASFARDGGAKITRWVVKLKHNPANNRMLARDDLSQEDINGMSGPGFGFFEPVKPFPFGDI